MYRFWLEFYYEFLMYMYYMHIIYLYKKVIFLAQSFCPSNWKPAYIYMMSILFKQKNVIW